MKISSWARWFSKEFSIAGKKLIDLKLWERSPFHQRAILGKSLNASVKNVTVSQRLGKSGIYNAAKMTGAQGQSFFKPGVPSSRVINIGSPGVERLMNKQTGSLITGDKDFLKARHAFTAYHESGEQVSQSLRARLDARANRLSGYIKRRYGSSTKGQKLLGDLNLKRNSVESLSEFGHSSKHVLDLEAYSIGAMENRLGTDYVRTVAKNRFVEIGDSARYMKQLGSGRAFNKIVGHHPGRMNTWVENTLGSDFTAGMSYDPKGIPLADRTNKWFKGDKAFHTTGSSATLEANALSKVISKNTKATLVKGKTAGLVNRVLHENKINHTIADTAKKASSTINKSLRNILKKIAR